MFATGGSDAHVNLWYDLTASDKSVNREYLLFKADNDALQAENQKLHAEVGWLKLLLLHLFKQLLLLHCPYMFHEIKVSILIEVELGI
ncbi:hypothetical protein Q3G72_016224 [Acer saccharum]|nr:hypothetical protein Q3G72_016224 [Acer saccharum]